MKLPGVRAWAARGSDPRIASFGPATPRVRGHIPAHVEALLPDLHVPLPGVPRLPRIPEDATDDQVVRAMALGWCLAHHAATGSVRHVQPSRWAPGTRATLVGAGRLLSQRGASPAAYARTRWASLVAHSGRAPAGPTAVYGWHERTLADSLALQRRAEGYLVHPGPEHAALAQIRARVDQAVRSQLPQTPEELAAILSGPGAGWRDQLDRATREAMVALRELETQITRGVWVWPTK